MQDLTTKYTVIQLKDPDHQIKLVKYLQDHKEMKKTSYCRFYMRGLCIMKSQYCKFAHDFDHLKLNQVQYKQMSMMECQISQKEERKKIFLDKTDFHQRPLFFIKKLDYMWLYRYQFSERYKLTGKEPVGVEEINKSEGLRHRIRQIMHREQWDKLTAFLQSTFPEADYTIDMFSAWFARLGFQKSQTYCKFGDFMRYLTYVKGYTQINVIMPPRVSRSIYYIKNKGTYMYSILDQLVKVSNQYRAIVKKMKEDRLKKMPESIKKKFICRFYMAGNCQNSRQDCFYIHNMEDINYDKDQEFMNCYRQPPKSKEDKMNYISLYRYYIDHKKPQDPQLTMDDINSKYGHKDAIRKRVHYQIYAGFLKKVKEQYKKQIMPVSFLREEYQKFGFNHTDQNKFGQLESGLWQLGYYQLQMRNQMRQKISCVAKVPQIEYMDKYFSNIIYKILKNQIDQQMLEKHNSQMLQSSLRRLVYSYSQGNQTQAPLHVYLRIKKKSFKEVLEELFPQYCSFIFFQGSQENYKKLMELIKKYLKKRKSLIHTIDEIDCYVRGLSIDQINMNKFTNYKSLLELGLLEMGKEVYFWPFLNASLVIDRYLFKDEQKEFKKYQWKNSLIKQQDLQLYPQFKNQKIIVVDTPQKLHFCRLILSSCYKYGVDLQGKLAVNGYIDFIQISCINEKKYIFVLDVWRIKKESEKLYEEMRAMIKDLFQDEKRMKIFHACLQDMVALTNCMGIQSKSIFDTSGMDIFFEQRRIYRAMYQSNASYEHTLKKLHHIRTPGLNQVLQRWEAPKGPNEYKDKFKKIFQQQGRQYFERRPIVDQFLQYSARDVQDLIQVQQRMLEEDRQNLWLDIGKLYVDLSV